MCKPGTAGVGLPPSAPCLLCSDLGANKYTSSPNSPTCLTCLNNQIAINNNTACGAWLKCSFGVPAGGFCEAFLLRISVLPAVSRCNCLKQFTCSKTQLQNPAPRPRQSAAPTRPYCQAAGALLKPPLKPQAAPPGRCDPCSHYLLSKLLYNPHTLPPLCAGCPNTWVLANGVCTCPANLQTARCLPDKNGGECLGVLERWCRQGRQCRAAACQTSIQSLVKHWSNIGQMFFKHRSNACKHRKQ